MARTNRFDGVRKSGAELGRNATAVDTSHGPGARRLRIALAQVDAAVGDLAGNVRCTAGMMRRAAAVGAQLVCFPELALPGYPPEDLLLKPSFIADNLRALEDLAAAQQSCRTSRQSWGLWTETWTSSTPRPCSTPGGWLATWPVGSPCSRMSSRC
jgi:hypothetical protein